MKNKRPVYRTRYHQFWKSKGFVLFLFIAIFFVSTGVVREVIRWFAVHYEIEKMETELARLEQRNADIQDIIAFLNTSSVQEKEARVKLGFQAPGENVVMFPEQSPQIDIVLPNSDVIEYVPLEDYQSNPEKWFYFFWNKFQNTPS